MCAGKGNHVLATVFVPEGKLTHFEKLITEYANHRTDKNGNRLDHQTLVDAISALRVATFESVWTDTAEAMPTDDAEVIWWEAWLPLGRDVARTLGTFGRWRPFISNATSEKSTMATAKRRSFNQVKEEISFRVLRQNCQKPG